MTFTATEEWERVRSEQASPVGCLHTAHNLNGRSITWPQPRLLLAAYGLRIGEVCALRLEDLDWTNEKIRVRRSKNRRSQEFPLTSELGNAILKYLQKVRPQSSSRFVFLSLHKPHRPMMTRGASCSIAVHIRALGCQLPHYGPHSLRHACATHLLDEGFSLKEIGDQLGHSSP